MEETGIFIITTVRHNTNNMKTLYSLELVYSLGIVLVNEMKGFLNIRPNESHMLESSVSTPVCGTILRFRSEDTGTVSSY